MLTTIGKYSALGKFFFYFIWLKYQIKNTIVNITGDSYPEFTEKLIPICKKLAVSGTPKQAKGAIRCLFVNVFKSKNDIFDDIVEVT